MAFLKHTLTKIFIMRRKKGFNMAKDVYYFNIKAGYNNTIVISRKTKKEAVRAYASYLDQRKDCEWMGKWDGKKFVDDVYTEAA